MKKICIFSVMIFSIPAMGANLSPIKETDLQNKQDKLNTINRELQKSREARLRDNLDNENEYDHVKNSNTDKTFLLKNVIVNVGDQPSYQFDFRAVVQPFLNTMVNRADIFSLIKEVNSELARKGFVTSMVSITPSNLSKGELKLNIVWGKIDGFLINGKAVNNFSDRILIKQVAPVKEGDVLNMHDIDQSVENINNNASSARVDIIPSSRSGYSYLNFILTPIPQPGFKFSIDNSGPGSSSAQGLYRYSADINFSNILFSSDTAGLKVNTRHIERDGGRYNYYAGLNYEIPYDYTKVSLQANTSNIGQPIHGEHRSYNSKSEGQTYNAQVSQVLTRNGTDKLTVYTSLQRKRTKNYIDGIMTDVNSRPYTDTSIGMQYSTYLWGGGVFSDLSYNRGMALMGGDKAAFDKNNIPSDFDRIVFDLSWQPEFSFLGMNFAYTPHISGQYSDYHLVDIYRLVVGDEYTVRGYKNDNFYGDSGIVFSNTLSLASGTYHGFTFSPFLGLDGAYLQNISESSDYATGVAAGIKSNWRRFSNSFTAGLPLRHSHVDEVIDRYTLYWSLSLTI